MREGERTTHKDERNRNVLTDGGLVESRMVQDAQGKGESEKVEFEEERAREDEEHVRSMKSDS